MSWLEVTSGPLHPERKISVIGDAMRGNLSWSELRGFAARLEWLATVRAPRRGTWKGWVGATVICLGIGLLVSEASAQASGPPGHTGRPAGAADAGAVGSEGLAMADLERLRISSQTWRRGGLGSRALVTFTLRNDSDHDVKDLEIACTFLRRDGNPLTERSRRMSDVVGMNNRKTFVRVSFGVVNVNADRAICRLVTARRA